MDPRSAGAAKRPPAEPVQIGGADPLATISLVDQLSRLRASVLVGQALVEAFPTETAWDAALQDQAVLGMLTHVSDTLQRVRRELPMLDPQAAPEVLQQAVEGRYSEALTAVEDLAAYLGVDPEDLLTFLVAL